jgi:hypothetical protein
MEMPPMRRLVFALTVLLLMPDLADAQHRAGAALAITEPRGEFDANTDTGYGFAMWYRYAFGPGDALAIGADGSVNGYGSARRRAPLSTTIPEITVDIETSNSTAFLQGSFEVLSPRGRFRPYGLLSGGAGLFFTTSSLEDPETDEVILSDTNHSDWTWIWSVGGGVRYLVHERPREGREPARFFVDLGATRLMGGDVEYLREGSLVTEDGDFDLDRRLTHSDIEIIFWRVGVAVQF